MLVIWPSTNGFCSLLAAASGGENGGKADDDDDEDLVCKDCLEGTLGSERFANDEELDVETRGAALALLPIALTENDVETELDFANCLLMRRHRISPDETNG